jgi:hypothetical protein
LQLLLLFFFFSGNSIFFSAAFKLFLCLCLGQYGGLSSSFSLFNFLILLFNLFFFETVLLFPDLFSAPPRAGLLSALHDFLHFSSSFVNFSAPNRCGSLLIAQVPERSGSSWGPARNTPFHSQPSFRFLSGRSFRSSKRFFIFPFLFPLQGGGVPLPPRHNRLGDFLDKNLRRKRPEVKFFTNPRNFRKIFGLFGFFDCL